MKKLLSLFIAFTIVVGMIPAVFANTADGLQEVTYNFTSSGHNATSTKDRLENTAGAKWYTDLNTDPSKGGAWAYLGSTTKSSRSTDTRIVYFDAYAQVKLDEDTYIAYKIQVPKTGKYGIKAHILSGNFASNGAQDIQMYIVPMTGELAIKLDADNGRAWTSAPNKKGVNREDPLLFDELGISALPLGEYSARVANVNVDTFGTVDMQENSNYALIFYSEKGGQFAPISLTLTEVVPEPEVSFAQSEYTTYDGGNVTLGSALSLSGEAVAGVTPVYTVANESVATVSGNVLTGVAKGETTVTATYAYNNKEYTATVSVSVTEPEKKHAYYFGTRYMTEEAKNAAGINDSNKEISDMTFVGTYDKIAVGESINNKNKWAVENMLSKCNATLKDSSLIITALKDAYGTDELGSRFVLKTKVDYNGTYNMAFRIGPTSNGTEADVYMIPANADIDEITADMLKSYNAVGRIDGDSSYSAVTNTQNVGPVELKEGDYYLVLDFNCARPETGNTTGGNQALDIRYIIFSKSEAIKETSPAEATVSAPTIAVTSNIPGAKINITTLNEIGESFALDAENVEGYTFLGWKRGVANGENQIDGTAKFTELKQNDIIKVYTNTFLTAVYEKNVPVVSDNPIIKFWNQDKAYLGEIAKNEITALPEMSLIGHTFLGWFTAPGKALELSNVTADTNAVASYEEKSYLDSDKEYDKVRVNGKDSEKMKYGEAVVCTDNAGKVTHWIRDGKIVSYDAEYTHYIWDGTVISSSYAQVDKKPLVVLENTTIDGAYMIEYDGAGKEIVEVGILFGAAESTPVVGRTFDKYVSQRNQNHGQLAAKPINDSYTVARGYMIYIDGEKTYVIYSE